MSSAAIMQPYVFPYIGYFQLIIAADQFVFLDDVNFIKKGWINRNYIYSANGPQLFTIPLSGASQNQTIAKTRLFGDEWARKLLKQLEQNYKKAPQFNDVFPILEGVFRTNHDTVSELAIAGVRCVFNYLNLPLSYRKSSELGIEGIAGQDRILAICKTIGADRYINAAGGKDLYDAGRFADSGVELNFMDCPMAKYKQFSESNTQPYSMIDVLMFNDPHSIKEMLANFKLVSASL